MGEPEVPAFDVEDMKNRKIPWRLLLRPVGIRLEPREGDEDPIEVPRAERCARVVHLHGLFIRRVISVQVEKKNRAFRLPEPAWDALQAWYPPYTRGDLKAALKRRLSWTFTLGLLYILGSLPLPGDSGSGVQAKPFDWVNAGLGIGFILIGVVSRLAPSRIFFLFDSLWCLSLVADTTEMIFSGHGTWFTYGVLYLTVLFAP